MEGDFILWWLKINQNISLFMKTWYVFAVEGEIMFEIENYASEHFLFCYIVTIHQVFIHF